MVVALCSWCHGCRYADDMAWRTAYEISLDIAAPIDTVWGLLADGRSWSDWSFIPRSELECEGIPAPDGVGAIRRLGMPPIVSRERIVEFTPPSRLVYESVGGIPVSGYRATVELAEVDGRTKVQWSGSFEPKWSIGAGAVGAYLKFAVNKISSGLVKEAERLAAADVANS